MRTSFERFTERARQVVVLSQEVARDLKHNYIGTEHLLAGLIREEHGLAARVLSHAGITEELVVEQIKGIIGSGEEAMDGQLPFTPRAKKVMEGALREALTLGHNYIGTEHILLGLLRETDGVAARILRDQGQEDSEALRNAVSEALSGSGERQQRRRTGPPPSSIVQTAERRREMDKEYLVSLNIDGAASVWLANVEDIGVLVANAVKGGGRNVMVDVQEPQRLPRPRRQRPQS